MEKKNTISYTVIAIIVLLVAVIGATFAYFQAQIGAGATANVTVTTQTTDSLAFNAANITVGPVTQANFGSGAGNKSQSGSASVVLTASNTGSSTYCYTAGLSVTSNDFVYTVNNSTPELTVTASKNGTNVISNYDITTLTTGTVSFPTALNGSTTKHTITATPSSTTTDSWLVTVTFINLNSDQQANTGKTFSGNVVFTKVTC